MSGEVEPTVERWAYVGRRIAADRKLAYGWCLAGDDSDDPRDGVMLFGKIKGMVVGGIYDVRVSRGVLASSVHGQPTYTGDRVDDEDLRLAWSTADRCSTTAKAIEARQRRDAKDDAFDQMVRPLREQMGRLRGHEQRAAFVHAVTEALFR